MSGANHGGNLTKLIGLLKVAYDIPTGSAFEPYVSPGIGFSNLQAQNLQTSILTSTTTTTFTPIPSAFQSSRSTQTTPDNWVVNDNATVFAYTAGVGLGYVIDPAFIIRLGYEFIGTSSGSLRNNFGTKSSIDATNLNSLQLGVQVAF